MNITTAQLAASASLKALAVCYSNCEFRDELVKKSIMEAAAQVYWADMAAKDYSGKYDLCQEGLEKFTDRACKRAIKGAWALHKQPSAVGHSYLFPELEAATGIKLCK